MTAASTALALVDERMSTEGTGLSFWGGSCWACSASSGPSTPYTPPRSTRTRTQASRCETFSGFRLLAVSFCLTCDLDQCNKSHGCL
jgi:hypothetical protein